MITIMDNVKDMEIYNSLEDGTHFIYKFVDWEFFAIKIPHGAILINCRNKFIIAKAYKNCLSIGNSSPEYDTFEEAIEYSHNTITYNL